MDAHANLPSASAAGEKATASWKVRRKDSWASSAHWLWKRFLMMSSRTGKSAQHAALVAVFLPSGQATRRVSWAVVGPLSRCHQSRECARVLRTRRAAGTLEGGDERDGGEQSFEGHC